MGIRVNVKYNLEVLLHWLWREQYIQPQGADQAMLRSQIFGLSIRTNLHNLYNDF